MVDLADVVQELSDQSRHPPGGDACVGACYAAILRLIERRRSVGELLADREPRTLIDWLRRHPQVEGFAGDRAQAYIDAATQGAPQARHAADPLPPAGPDGRDPGGRASLPRRGDSGPAPPDLPDSAPGRRSAEAGRAVRGMDCFGPARRPRRAVRRERVLRWRQGYGLRLPRRGGVWPTPRPDGRLPSRRERRGRVRCRPRVPPARPVAGRSLAGGTRAPQPVRRTDRFGRGPHVPQPRPGARLRAGTARTDRPRPRPEAPPPGGGLLRGPPRLARRRPARSGRR